MRERGREGERCKQCEICFLLFLLLFCGKVGHKKVVYTVTNFGRREGGQGRKGGGGGGVWRQKERQKRHTKT